MRDHPLFLIRHPATINISQEENNYWKQLSIQRCLSRKQANYEFISMPDLTNKERAMTENKFIKRINLIKNTTTNSS